MRGSSPAFDFKMNQTLFIVIAVLGILVTIVAIYWKSFVFHFLAATLLVIAMIPIYQGFDVKVIQTNNVYDNKHNLINSTTTEVNEIQDIFTQQEKSAFFLVFGALVILNIGLAISYVLGYEGV